MTIKGRSASYAMRGSQPSFRVRPGEKVQMTVAVTAPRHIRLTALWFGISTGIWGTGPTGMHPILAHYRQQVLPGVHRFLLRWRVPAGRFGGSLFLVSSWSSHQPPVSVGAAIAVLALNSDK